MVEIPPKACMMEGIQEVGRWMGFNRISYELYNRAYTMGINAPNDIWEWLKSHPYIYDWFLDGLWTWVYHITWLISFMVLFVFKDEFIKPSNYRQL